MRLFAEHGYDATSVADIQEAAGMARGSGALYKHFPSKRALLEAGIARFVDQGTRELDRLADLPTDDVGVGLAGLVKAAMSASTMDGDMLRIVYRELVNFPDLRDTVRDQRLQAAFCAVGEWLAVAARQNSSRLDDPEAASAVLFGSIAFFQLAQALLVQTPGRVSTDRFERAWVDLATRMLRPALGDSDDTSGADAAGEGQSPRPH